MAVNLAATPAATRPKRNACSNACNSTELRPARAVILQRGTGLAYQSLRGRLTDCLLRSLPDLLDEILERFSSSSLPPSFALGRCVAFFMTRGTAQRGTPFPFSLASGSPR